MPRTQAPQVVDRSSARSLQGQVAWGAGLEALLALVMLSSSEGLERYERGLELERLLRSSLSSTATRLLGLLRTPAGDAWAGLIGQVARPNQENDRASVIQQLEALEPTDLKMTMMGLHRIQFRSKPGPEELIQLAKGAGWADEARAVFKVPAPELKKMVIETLNQLPESLYISRNSDQLLLRNAGEAQRFLSETGDASVVVERLTHGLVYRPEPGITDILLIPSLVHRPWTRLLDHGSTKIFCYAALLESELTAPDVGLIATYRALGDATRLRILRQLAGGPISVARISEELGLAKSTVHEHLLSLRAAGLVRMSTSGGFELQPEFPDLNWMLKEFLGLEMRRACEGCGRSLEQDGVAYICSYECTYCDECARSSDFVCPHCAGELVMRPKRTSAAQGRRPRPRIQARERSLSRR